MQPFPTFESFIARFLVPLPPPPLEAGEVRVGYWPGRAPGTAPPPHELPPLPFPSTASSWTRRGLRQSRPCWSPAVGLVPPVAYCLTQLSGGIIITSGTASSAAAVPGLQRLISTPDARAAALRPAVPVTRFDSDSLRPSAIPLPPGWPRRAEALGLAAARRSRVAPRAERSASARNLQEDSKSPGRFEISREIRNLRGDSPWTSQAARLRRTARRSPSSCRPVAAGDSPADRHHGGKPQASPSESRVLWSGPSLGGESRPAAPTCQCIGVAS